MLGKIFRLFSGALVAGLILLVSGCGPSLSTMNPVGPIGEIQRNITVFTILMMLFVLIPIVTLTLGIAWRYRKSNTNSTYTPNWDHSWIAEIFIWGGPLVILVIIAIMTWISTHDLDPYKAIQSDAEPIEIQAVATEWKWLFIYPEEGVASVDEFAFPQNVPLRIHLTSNSVMNAFMVQRMGTQIFAMSGMRTELNLMAEETGDFAGGNYQYTGEGFSKMRFVAKSMTRDNYQQWLQKARQQGTSMNFAKFKQFAKPSVPEHVSYFSPVDSDLFADVIGQFHAPKGPSMTADAHSASSH